MKTDLPSRHLVLLLFLSSLFVALPMAAANHVIDVGGSNGNRFSPSSLTIQVGDSVTWRNMGGFHNVSAPGEFRCSDGCDGEGGNGGPSTSSWEFTRTFNSAASISYFCEPHQGVGMTGTLTVQGAAAAPGSVRLFLDTIPVNEDDGNAAIGLTRTGGTDGVVTVDVATSDGSAVAGSDYTGVSTTVTWTDGDGLPKAVNVPILDDAEVESLESINFTVSNLTGGATLNGPAVGTIRIIDNDQSSPGTVTFVSDSVGVAEDDGTATVSVQRSSGSEGAISVVYGTASGSAEEGSDFVAKTGTTSWADGDSSVQDIVVDLIDDSEEEGTESFSVALSAPTGGADLGTPSTVTVTLSDDEATGCVAGNTTLCLGAGGRFAVTVAWRIPDGTTGVGETIDFGSADSGLFYFFDQNNAEMLIKVLDGCPITNHFWVFFAATTDVEFTTTVVDTSTGMTQTYSNPLGQRANAVTDTSAFATCN